MISKCLYRVLALSLVIHLFINKAALSQVSANAGPDITVCTNLQYPIGGTPTASGGTPPYSYSWLPLNGLNNSSLANPTLTPNVNTGMYVVTVTDALGNSDKDTVIINFYPVNYASAGNDTAVCFGEPAYTGKPSNPSGGGIGYSWSPVVGLDNAFIPNPTATINTTTTYTVTITSPTCPNFTDSVTITIWALPSVSAGPDFTIEEGDIVTLQGSGAVNYWWAPNNTRTYFTTANPDAWPFNTTTYGVAGTDANGCVNYDQVTVTVIPSSKLFIYNTFTPNFDGVNEGFWIGNIWKYPDNKLSIYNRYGQLVFSASPYLNDWDGRNLGDEVPDGTYYYVLDPGDGSDIRYGSVTIIR